jgi:uncharacterized protein DUF3168
MLAVATAIPPLRVAIFAALETITMLAGDKVYHEGDVPRTSVLPYIVVGTATETKTGAGFIGQPGQEQTHQIKCWGDNSWVAQQVYEQAVLKLDGQILTVLNHRNVLCQMEYLTDFAEPNPEVTGHVVIGRLRTRTIL